MSTKPIFVLATIAALALGLLLTIAPAYASASHERCGTLNCGDLNADGQIGASDILACMREASLIGGPNCTDYCTDNRDFPLIETCADVTGDERATASDCLAIARVAVKLDTPAALTCVYSTGKHKTSDASSGYF